MKAELLRTRKKLEADVGELETALEHANQVGYIVTIMNKLAL